MNDKLTKEEKAKLLVEIFGPDKPEPEPEPGSERSGYYYDCLESMDMMQRLANELDRREIKFEDSATGVHDAVIELLKKVTP